ncbi:MAG: ABC transporter permease [Actinomyces bowdenii]|nr:ABC transporter permease [Actinomyces bowdenii]
MIRLLVMDLRHHAGTWVWTAVVALVAGAGVCAQLQIVEGMVQLMRAFRRPDAGYSVAWVFITAIGIAAASVLSSTISLVMVMRRREYGLWKVLGMRPSTVRWVVLGQLGLLGAAAGAAGLPGGMLLAPAVLQIWRWDQPTNLFIRAVEPQVVPAQVGTGAVAVALFTILGGLRAAHEAETASGAALLGGRPQEESGGIRWRVGPVLRVLCALASGIGYVVLLAMSRSASPRSPQAVLSALGCGLACLCLVIASTPWVVPALERLLTAAVSGSGIRVFIAGRTCAQESARSTATVMPFAVAIGVVAIIYGGQAIDLTASGLISLLCLPFLVAWVGGVAIIAMGAGRRRRDAALLEAAGARRGDLIAIEIIEGLVHALVAIALGAVVSLGTSLVMSTASGKPFLEVLAGTPWKQLAVISAATLGTIAVTVVGSSRARGAGPGLVLRAQD